MNQAYVRKVPANLAMLTWRHPRTTPTGASHSEHGYLGIFAEHEDSEWDFYYVNIDYCPEHGWYAPSMDADELKGLGLIAWMPMPELPYFDKEEMDGE